MNETKHIDCPCWITGRFRQAPCPYHDGKDEYPTGSWATALAAVEKEKEKQNA